MQGLNRIKIPVLIILTHRFVKIGLGLKDIRLLPLITTAAMTAVMTAAMTAVMTAAMTVVMTADLIRVLAMELILVKEMAALMGEATAEATAMEILDTVELTTQVMATAKVVTLIDGHTTNL
jgi:hypothetical protein